MIKLSFLFFSVFYFSQDIVQNHCGLDLTTYIIVKPKSKADGLILSNLKVYLVDNNENMVINTNGDYSFLDINKPLFFKKNTKSMLNDEQKWDLSIIKEEVYYLCLKSNFYDQVENFRIKIEDLNLKFPTESVPIYSVNLFKLCQQEIKRFGPKMSNQPIIVEF